MKLSEEQENALQLMLSGKNVFLTGEAGTGKSTILREFRRVCPGTCVYLAPTGVAAINIEGTTLHSFFLLPPGLLTPDSMTEICHGKRRAMIRMVRTIVIDEISMVRSDVFTAIDWRLRSLARREDMHKPFGGKQIIIVGDFFQLPPVVKSEFEAAYLANELGGPYAFQTRLWKEANFQIACLKDIHRQKGDMHFVRLLNNVRHGQLKAKNIADTDDEEPLNAMEVLNRFCPPDKHLPRAAVCLCPTNRQATTINDAMMTRLQSDSVVFNANVAGKFKKEDFPTEAMLELKVGARVMVLCNKHLPDGTFEYVNGDIGTIQEITEHPKASVIVELDKGTTVTLTMNKWSNYEYVLEKDEDSGRNVIRQREIGTFLQIPLKLAYAITIHKSQGLTLECVDLKLGGGCFAHGQLYTALSRCRSLAGLRIDRHVMTEDLIIDREVVDFYNEIEAKLPPHDDAVMLAVPPEHLEAMREYLKQLQKGK